MTGARQAVPPVAAVLLLACGCGSAPSHASSPARAAGPPSLATSLAAAGGTWAVVEMGGSAAGHNNFWQLLVRPAGTPAWRLVTPPGVASNGGLVAAPAGGQSLVAAFRPSQRLTFSPLAVTRDNGATWTAGLLDAPLADLPASLAAAPGSGRLLALLADGTAEVSPAGGTRWARLITRRSLAASPAGRRCGLTGLTSAAFGPSGIPLLAGTCTHAGTAGIFALIGGTWFPAGPAPPAALAGRPTSVLRLTVAGTREIALLTAGTGRDAVLLAAWSNGVGRWTLSPPLRLGGAVVRSVSAGSGGALGIVLNDRAGVTLTGPGASWQWLPFLPAGTQALAPGPAGRADALAAAGTTFTDWTWTAGSAAWARAQALHVPIQYGSSG